MLKNPWENFNFGFTHFEKYITKEKRSTSEESGVYFWRTQFRSARDPDHVVWAKHKHTDYRGSWIIFLRHSVCD